MKTVRNPVRISALPFTLLLLASPVAAQETVISLGTNVSGTIASVGEVDWYSVTTDVLGDLAITQTAWPGFIETRTEVYGPDDQVTPQPNLIEAAAPGTYFIKVYSANDGVSEEIYTFNATLTPATTGNDIDDGGNAPEAAIVLALGSEVSDTIGPSSATAGVQDEDWYAVTTSVVGDFTVTQTAWPPFIETRISVFGPDDPTLAQGNTIEAAAPGTYYLRVWSANDGASSAIYTFSTSLVTATTGNDVDGGANSPEGAVPITLGAAVSDTIAPSKESAGVQDEDWYTVTTDVVGDLTVTQTAWPPFIETRISVFGPDDPTLAQGNTIPAAAPGTYYLRVWSANEGSSSDVYTFSMNLEPATTGNDVDGGANDAEGAVPITAGETVTDTIAPSKETAGTQDEDWFVLTLDTAGELTVTQTLWPGFIETRLAVFGPDSSTTAFTNPATPGAYYVRMWSANDGSSIDPYAFTTEFVSSGGGTGGSGTGGSGTGGSSGGGTTGGSGTGGSGTGGSSTGGASDGGEDPVGEDTGGTVAGGAGTEEPGSAGAESTAGGAAGDGAGSDADAGATSEGGGDGEGGDAGGGDDEEEEPV
ncbi:MAG TPA: hypothetical protein PLU22_07045, partial [Polyangiaceae bacterium]|nr:hypothetical protein [Polyangiaceae bacterium]